MNGKKMAPQLAVVARPSSRFRSLSATDLVTSTLNFCRVSLRFGVLKLAFMYKKNFVVFWKRLLCFRKEI